MVLNEIHDNFKYLFDFSFDEQSSKGLSSKTLNVKIPDFYKASNARDMFSVGSKGGRNKNFALGNLNHFIPIIARNRKLMVICILVETTIECQLTNH